MDHEFDAATARRRGAAGRSNNSNGTNDRTPGWKTWRKAFTSFGDAAVRLHRLRELRAKMLDNALKQFEFDASDE